MHRNQSGRQRFFIGHDMCNLPEGTHVAQLPPHITITPPALIPEECMNELGKVLEDLSSSPMINIAAIGHATFGTEQNPIRVTKFDRPPELEQLHKKLMSNLGRLGCEYIYGTGFALDNYAPHVSNVILPIGSQAKFSNLTLYGRTSDGMDRIIIKRQLS